MFYSIQINRDSFTKVPVILRSIGLDHEQEAIDRPNGFPLWQFFFCVKGSGELVINNKRGLLQEGQAALIYPNSGHSYHPISDSWVVHFIGFNGNACQNVMNCLHFNSNAIFNISDPSVVRTHIENIRRLMTDTSSPKYLQYSKELYSFLLDLGTVTEPAFMTPYTDVPDTITDAALYLDDHYAEDISLSQLAEQQGLSPEYLCSRFQDVACETIIQYLTRIRIEHAKAMLLDNPKMNTGEIGRRCGFNDASYFCKVFRQQLGVTPTQFRAGYIPSSASV